MIQRIQSVYLLLTTLLSLLFLNGNLLSFINKTGSALYITFSGMMESQGESIVLIGSTIPLTISVIAIAVLALVSIFLFKNRILQIRVVMVLIALILISILLAGYYAYLAISKYEATLTPGVKMALPIIVLILAILAYRGIKKDELLVKSYDRLR